MTTDGAESWTCSSWPLEGKYRNSKVVPFVKMRKRKAFMVLQISRETTYFITQYSGTTMAAWNTLTGRMELNALQEWFDKCLQMFWCFCTHESATIGICYNEVNSSWPVALFSVNKETTNSCLSHPRWMNDTRSFFSFFFWWSLTLMSRSEPAEGAWVHFQTTFHSKGSKVQVFWSIWRLVQS